jgi:hypothetical protein
MERPFLQVKFRDTMGWAGSHPFLLKKKRIKRKRYRKTPVLRKFLWDTTKNLAQLTLP